MFSVGWVRCITRQLRFYQEAAGSTLPHSKCVALGRSSRNTCQYESMCFGNDQGFWIVLDDGHINPYVNLPRLEEQSTMGFFIIYTNWISMFKYTFIFTQDLGMCCEWTCRPVHLHLNLHIEGSNCLQATHVWHSAERKDTLHVIFMEMGKIFCFSWFLARELQWELQHCLEAKRGHTNSKVIPMQYLSVILEICSTFCAIHLESSRLRYPQILKHSV